MAAENQPESERGARTGRGRTLATEILFGGGLLITIFGIGGEAFKEWWRGNEAELCQLAHETMLDDALNPEVPAERRRRYLELQSRHAISCASRGHE